MTTSTLPAFNADATWAQLMQHPDVAVRIAAALGYVPTEEQQKDFFGPVMRVAIVAYVAGKTDALGRRAARPSAHSLLASLAGHRCCGPEAR
jgi:hypothetical protein